MDGRSDGRHDNLIYVRRLLQHRLRRKAKADADHNNGVPKMAKFVAMGLKKGGRGGGELIVG